MMRGSVNENEPPFPVADAEAVDLEKILFDGPLR
jgi:hypothetical protein